MSDSMHRSLDAAIGRQAPAEQVEALADVLESVPDPIVWHDGYHIASLDMARAVLASDWLADRIARERAEAAREALRELADDFELVQAVNRKAFNLSPRIVHEVFRALAAALPAREADDA